MAYTSKEKLKYRGNKCAICGWSSGDLHAAHIIDEAEAKEKNIPASRNIITLCPNCHTVFDGTIRPILYKALLSYGSKNLPKSWMKNNKTNTIS